MCALHLVYIAEGLVGVGLITQSEDNPGFLTLDKGYNDMSKFLNRQDIPLNGGQLVLNSEHGGVMLKIFEGGNTILLYVFVKQAKF